MFPKKYCLFISGSFSLSRWRGLQQSTMTHSHNTRPGWECSGTLYLMTPSAPTPELRDNTHLAKRNKLVVRPYWSNQTRYWVFTQYITQICKWDLIGICRLLVEMGQTHLHSQSLHFTAQKHPYNVLQYVIYCLGVLKRFSKYVHTLIPKTWNLILWYTCTRPMPFCVYHCSSSFCSLNDCVPRKELRWNVPFKQTL